MKDLIDRHLIAELVDAHGNVHWEDIAGLPSEQAIPAEDRDAVTMMEDGTLNITMCIDVAKVRRILLNQQGSNYGALYYKE